MKIRPYSIPFLSYEFILVFCLDCVFQCNNKSVLDCKSHGRRKISFFLMGSNGYMILCWYITHINMNSKLKLEQLTK
jgi:hypothetical protein